jgi:phenylalanyl-tRNA synthetase beta chain
VKLSLNWLRELVDLPEDLDEICERLTLLGLEVEEVEHFDLSFPDVVVGHVLEAEPHPDADRLRVCRVDAGGETLGIVCGAPNVAAGQRVPVAKVGAVLPGDFRIKKSKIRGQVSLGMICSEKELGLGQAQDGIMVLDTEAAPGTPFDELYGVQDTVIEFEVTPNRPDWLSHVGVARELAAYYGGALRIPEVDADVPVVEEDSGWRIRIDDPEGCWRFRGRLIDDVEVGPSPWWMRRRLLAIGQRPINAIVDASNYVLHECGHPNHCFDRDKIHGETVVVRRAAAGERFTTLDDTERTLADHHLLVADEKGGLALAGIMGGADSEVDESTEKLLLEVAVFDPQTVRRGRRTETLSTDASYRFERGVDHDLVPWASARLAQLIERVAGGRVHDVVIEATGRRPERPESFPVRLSQVRRLLGVDVEPDEVTRILRGLDIGVEPIGGDAPGVRVTPPSFRHDLLAEVDVIEEIGRHHGFDQLPERARVPMVVPAARGHGEVFLQRLRQAFAARGFHEMMGSAFFRDDDPDALRLPEDDARRTTVAVLNPVVQGEARLRTTAVPEMARTVERNRRRGWTGPIRLFQIARTYQGRSGETLPDEREQLVVAWSGPARPLHPDEPGRPVDPYDALGDLEGVLGGLGIECARRPDAGEPYLREGSAVELRHGERRLGLAGEVAPTVRRALDVEDAVLIAEIDLEALVATSEGVARYTPFSAFPPSRRDLSLVVPESVAWAEIEATVAESLDPLLESCELFDVYRGDDLPGGTAAYGVRLTLRSPKGTLKDKHVDKQVSRLLAALEERHGIRLRSGGDEG